MSSPQGPPEPKKAKKGSSPWPLYAIVIALLGSGVFVCVSSMGLSRAADEYVDLVREGHLDAAYDLLDPEIQNQVPRDEFPNALETSRLQGAGAPGWNYKGAGSDGRACTEGVIKVDGERLGIRLYLRDSGEGWRAHTLLLYDAVVPEGPWSCNRPR